MLFRATCDLILPGPQRVHTGDVMEFDAAPSKHWEPLDPPAKPARKPATDTPRVASNGGN